MSETEKQLNIFNQKKKPDEDGMRLDDSEKEPVGEKQESDNAQIKMPERIKRMESIEFIIDIDGIQDKIDYYPDDKRVEYGEYIIDIESDGTVKSIIDMSGSGVDKGIDQRRIDTEKKRTIKKAVELAIAEYKKSHISIESIIDDINQEYKPGMIVELLSKEGEIKIVVNSGSRFINYSIKEDGSLITGGSSGYIDEEDENGFRDIAKKVADRIKKQKIPENK